MQASLGAVDASAPATLDAASRLLWGAVLTGAVEVTPLDPATADTLRVLAARLARRCSAGWAASLLAPLTAVQGAPAVDSEVAA